MTTLDYSKHLYFVSKEGHIKSILRGKKGGKKKTVVKNAVKKEPGYLYFVKKDGTVGRVAMKRKVKGKKKK
jgi:hypothetical protein